MTEFEHAERTLRQIRGLLIGYVLGCGDPDPSVDRAADALLAELAASESEDVALGASHLVRTLGLVLTGWSGRNSQEILSSVALLYQNLDPPAPREDNDE